MTHADLIKIASGWLQRNRCPVVLTDLVTSGEIPDAIGFGHVGITTLIECKASRSDFLRDAKKPFRREPYRGLARYRYYMAPKGLIQPDELPGGWGLITVNDKGKTRRVAVADFQEQSERAHRSEIGILVSAMRRLSGNVEGIGVKVYTIDSKTITTIGIEPEEE